MKAYVENKKLAKFKAQILSILQDIHVFKKANSDGFWEKISNQTPTEAVWIFKF